MAHCACIAKLRELGFIATDRHYYALKERLELIATDPEYYHEAAALQVALATYEIVVSVRGRGLDRDPAA